MLLGGYGGPSSQHDFKAHLCQGTHDETEIDLQGAHEPPQEDELENASYQRHHLVTW